MKRRFAFTLVELIVVIGIIVVLIAILLPAMGKGREQARKALFAANLAAIGKCCGVYAAQFKDHLPYAVGYAPLYCDVALGTTDLMLDILNGQSNSLRPDGARKIFYCPTNLQQNEGMFWNFVAVGGSQCRRLGYNLMIKRSPAPHYPWQGPFVDATSADPGHRQKRMPPLGMYDRMQGTFMGQRCDLALDVVVSNKVGAWVVDAATGMGSGEISTGYSWPIDYTRNNFVEVSMWGFPVPPPPPYSLPLNHVNSSSHLAKAKPTGANVLSFDGRVEWRPFDPQTTLVIGHAYSDKGAPEINPKNHGIPPYFWFPYPP